jgi:transposase
MLHTKEEETMRTIGIELAVAGVHKAIVFDDRTGEFVTPVLTLHPEAGSLAALLERARQGASSPDLRVVMEPTGMVWFPVAAYLVAHQITVYLIKGQEVADLRRYYKRHAKSDRVDVRVLARVPGVNPDGIHPLALPSPDHVACQRACREVDRLTADITAISNRLRDTDRWAWPGLDGVVFRHYLCPAARWFRTYWYDPQQVVAAGAAVIRQRWQDSGCDPADAGDWCQRLVPVAQQALALYGTQSTQVNYTMLTAEVARQQEMLTKLEEMCATVQKTAVRPLYRTIHPTRDLETIKGVGEESAAVYASFVGDAQRFARTAAFRGWTGMVPGSSQSGESEAQGMRITKAGPDVVKKMAYLDADVARRWDPQIAAIYYDQMMHKGKHHTQAVCACATHLMDRVFRVLHDHRPYELRDVDGHPVTGAAARTIITERYTVPEAVRKERSKLARQVRRDRRAEKRQARESDAADMRGKHNASSATGATLPHVHSIAHRC